MIFSFSRLSTFEQCPRKFYFRYVLGYEETDSIPLLLGKSAHKAIEVYINTQATIEQAIDSGLAEIGYHKAVKYDEVLQLMLSSWDRINYLRNKKQFDNQSVIVEHHFQVNIGVTEDIQLQGYIDILENNYDGTVRIIDWKSGWKRYSLFESNQILLYSWVTSMVTEGMFRDVIGEYYYLRFNRNNHDFGKIIPKNKMDEARFWAVDLALTIKERLDMLESEIGREGIATKRCLDTLFPIQFNAFCKSCPMATQCFK